MTKPSELYVTQREWPEGSPFFRVYCGNESLGIVVKTERGFTPLGLRKPLPTLEVAARELVWRCTRLALKEAARFAAMVDLPVTLAAVDPVDGIVTDRPRA